jgi:two-component system OmpR family response regulator
MRLLLVEEDRMAGARLAMDLRAEGYAVDWLRDGAAALAALRGPRQGFGLVVLGWNLPCQDGLSVLRSMRAAGNTVPILLITACNRVGDRVIGLDSGADDCLVRPFALIELKARLRSLLRRTGPCPAVARVHGDLALDVLTHTVRRRGRSIALTPRELALLACLMERPQRVLSRTQLEQRLYGWQDGVRSNAVEFLLHGLRRKLGPACIENVRGVGWRMGPAR